MAEGLTVISLPACEPCLRSVEKNSTGGDPELGNKYLLGSAAEKARDQEGEALHELTNRELNQVVYPAEKTNYYAAAGVCGRRIARDACELWQYDTTTHEVVARQIEQQ